MSNVRDFPTILQEWAAAQRGHAGVILVCGVDHREFDLVIRRIELLQLYPDTETWPDLAVGVNRDHAQGS